MFEKHLENNFFFYVCEVGFKSASLLALNALHIPTTPKSR